MSLPTEAQIRDAAARLGHADEHGNYPQRLRSKLAAALQLADHETAEADPAPADTTAAQLARFDAELKAAGITCRTARVGLVVAAGEHLLKTVGLQLHPREETTP
ncbi:hypothetical protein ACQPW1_00450 [Nocardia sp. CA-128927]|uniref:hypothetical protein n=1 Tax=Nocardia sp. CA-128927 TaxID=3239975 RepID=UPI003D99D8F7